MEKIQVRNLTFKYPTQSASALDNVSFDISRGEFVVVFGKSGCGKSTLLRLLKPLLAPEGTKSGSICYADSQTLPQREQTEKIGFVMQDPESQIVCDKVWHELAFGLESLSIPADEIRLRVAETASFFGIQDKFHQSTAELSGGEKQLLNLASAMVQNPELLILDEPTSRLDPISAYDFFKVLERINKELGITIIMSEHRTDEVFPLADKIIAMDNGKIIAAGTAREVGAAVKNTDLFFALPAPMRIFYDGGGSGDAPLTVRDGHIWLTGMPLETPSFPGQIQPSGEKAVVLRDVWFRYEKDSPDVAKGLSADIFKGEFYAIVGGNGVGKSTALSIIARANKPYRGKVSTCGKVSMLPQNPKSLFSEKSVMLNLSSLNNPQKLDEVIELCELNSLLESHPFDLSGGEQQRLALAMVLLSEPDILLLDEPTKGMDAFFKEKLAEILSVLKGSGKTIIMVSHDIEFCAAHADRCGMFFDGRIISENTPRNFFSKNNFYTTSASRMSGSLIPDAVLDEDILASLGKQKRKRQHIKEKTFAPPAPQKKIADKKSNKPLGIFFGILFAAAMIFGKDKLSFQMLSLIFLGVSCSCLIPQSEFASGKKNPQKKKKSLGGMAILLLVPLTVLWGIYFLNDRKYYFISLLIILETMLSAAVGFERKRPRAREIVLISTLCAIAVAGRAAFAPFPQFKPVTAIVIITGMTLGGETGFLVGAIAGFVSNFFFGQGPWTPWQMTAWGVVGLLSGILFASGAVRKTRINLSLFAIISVMLVYGVIVNTATVLISNPHPTLVALLSAYAAGVPFDILHAASTVFFLWISAEPMYDRLERIKLKYGIA